MQIIRSGVILWLLVFFTACSLAQSPSPQQQLIERIKWFYTLKKHLAPQWPGFTDAAYDVPLAYFTDSFTYIVDKDGVIPARAPSTVFFKDGDITIYQSQRTDNKPFHMETSYDHLDSSALYFQYPVMMCSDFETTRQTIEEVTTLQQWGTMILHEYFHGFQFRHSAMIRYGNDSVQVRNSELQSWYDQYPWYRNSVEQENRLLLNCLAVNDQAAIRKTLRQFMEQRQKRWKQLKDTLKVTLHGQEDFLEKMEGSARYMEWNLYEGFKNIPANIALQSLDTAYQAAPFQNFHITQEKWLYETARSSYYFYATGFNMLRLLDKLKVPYKAHFFDQTSNTPYNLLVKWCRSGSRKGPPVK